MSQNELERAIFRQLCWRYLKHHGETPDQNTITPNDAREILVALMPLIRNEIERVTGERDEWRREARRAMRSKSSLVQQIRRVLATCRTTRLQRDEAQERCLRVLDLMREPYDVIDDGMTRHPVEVVAVPHLYRALAGDPGVQS